MVLWDEQWNKLGSAVVPAQKVTWFRIACNRVRYCTPPSTTMVSVLLPVGYSREVALQC